MFYSHHFAEVSKLAYLDNEKKKFKDLGYTYSQFFDIDGAQAYVLWSKDFITIAFRGTEPDEFNDIKADLKATKHNGYHEGFYIEYMKLHDKIKDKVDDLLEKKERPLYIAGHSLGGAMATVCACHWPNAHEVYTYGAPRALSRRRAKELKVPHKRHVNNNDVVPKVPPALLFYKHHGELCYINYYGNIRKMSTWQRFKDSWRGRWHCIKVKKVPFDGLFDHSIDEYAKFLSDGE